MGIPVESNDGGGPFVDGLAHTEFERWGVVFRLEDKQREAERAKAKVRRRGNR